MFNVIPSILTSSPQEVKDMLKRCEGVVGRVSIDVIDGKYVNNRTFDLTALEDFEIDLKLDFQLMVAEPINWVEKCVRAGADRIIGHVEKMDSQTEFVGKASEIGINVGLGLDIDTPISTIEPVIINDLDLILLMSVKAGFGGQKFERKVLEKVKALNKIRAKDNTPFLIQVDGGINLVNICDLRKEGVDEVSVGRSLFGGDIEGNIDRLKKAAYKNSLSLLEK